MAIQLVHFSDCGPERPSNQDCYIVKICTSFSGIFAIATVCDGMGGLECGEVASAVVADSFGKWFDAKADSMIKDGFCAESIRCEWELLIHNAHEKIKRYALRHRIRVGTTASVILLTPSEYYTMQVGDSRVYLDNGDYLSCITKDQTLAMKAYDAGEISWSDILLDERRNILLQCVGNQSVNPVFQFGETPPVGSILLCSDGFYHTLEIPDLHVVLQKSVGRKKLQSALLKMAVRGRKSGESDNMTCVALRWDSLFDDRNLYGPTDGKTANTIEL